MKHICELCSMDGVYTKTDEQGVVHYFCEHHAPSGSVKSKQITLHTKSKIATYAPLVLIFLGISIVTIGASFLRDPFSVDFTMRIFMGVFFAVFGIFKVVNLKAFAQAYSTYDVIAMRYSKYAYVYPFIELAFAALYIFDIGGIYRDISTIVIMSISAYGVFLKLRQKEEIPCACLGMVFNTPMTWVTLVEDVLMVLMAVWMVLM